MITGKRVNDESPDIDILSLSGRLGVRNEEEFTAALTAAVGESTAGLLLDMSDVDFVSSSGLRALLLAYKQAASGGKKMAMMHVHPRVYKIFKLTLSETMFRICDAEPEAMKVLAALP